MKKAPLRFRQVHLDFHTSEHCPDVGAQFDEEQFIGALKKGRVNSVTVFAMCHHGWCYYPTRTGLRHPNLKTDLLGRMLAAGQKADINMPVYITVGWNDKASREHPEWTVRQPDGSIQGPAPLHPHSPRPGGWFRLCLNTPYLDQVVLAVTREVMELYNPSGIFFDITGEYACCCDWCRAGMKERGLDSANPAHRVAFAKEVYKNYLKKTTELVWRHNPHATIYHNGKDKKGRHDLYPYWSHYEIESLPTASWGYNHFPSTARYFTMLPQFDVLSMTGKFHRFWGEFGGFKNAAALRYEAAQMVSLGCKCSIGDQLHPSGKMDEETYRIIGEAYQEVEEREEWLDEAEPVADVAILAPSAVMKNTNLEPSEVGAGQMLLESQVPFVSVDETMDFSPYKVLILPDSVLVDEALQAKLEACLAAGAKMILSGESGLDPRRKGFVLDVGADYSGPSPWDVEYIEVGDKIAKNMVRSPFLVYQTGVTTRVKDAEILAKTWQPFFNRTYEHFCSHGNTPYEKPASWPAIIRKGPIIHVAQPIFRVYDSQGMQLHRDLFKNCLDLLYENPLLRVDLPSCGRVSLMRQRAKGRLALHLMYANPIRRGATEVIEDVVPLFNVAVSLAVEKAPKKVCLAPSGERLDFTCDQGRLRFTVPKIEMSQIVAIE